MDMFNYMFLFWLYLNIITNTMMETGCQAFPEKKAC